MARVIGRPGESGQQAADEHVGVADPDDVDALGIGGRRSLADGAQVEAGARPVDPVPRERDEQETDVGQDALLAEQDRPEERDLRQHAGS